MKLYDRLWPTFFHRLPAKFVYFCAMRVWCEASSSKEHSSKAIGTITFTDALEWFDQRYGIHEKKGGNREDSA